MQLMHKSRPPNMVAMRAVEQPASRLPGLRSLLTNGGSGEQSGRQASATKSNMTKADFTPTESFTHLKLTAEKMMHDQATTKTDLSITQSKLQKFEKIEKTLELKKQELQNENHMLRVSASFVVINHQDEKDRSFFTR